MATVLATVSIACAVASLPVYAYNVSRLGGGKVPYLHAHGSVAGYCSH